MSTKKQQNQKGEEDSLDSALCVLLLDFVVPGGLRTAKEAPDLQNSTSLAHLRKQGFPSSS